MVAARRSTSRSMPTLDGGGMGWGWGLTSQVLSGAGRGLVVIVGVELLLHVGEGRIALLKGTRFGSALESGQGWESGMRSPGASG